METNANGTPLMTFDTSSLAMAGRGMSEDEFERDVEVKLQKILDTVFADNYNKRRIRHTRVSLNFACPYCHDSATDDHKKRGHLNFSGKGAGFFVCFNCGHKTPMNKFFRDFSEEMTLSEITYLNGKVIPSAGSQANSTGLTAAVISSDTAYEWAIDREYVKNVLCLKDISQSGTPIAWNYLTGRCQYRNHERFLYSEQTNQIFILNLIRERVIGMQIRDLTQKRYLTMSIEKMRKMLLRDETPVPDTVSRLSCVFNIFNVDFGSKSKPVLVTEGPFDAFLLPNCFALAGAGKSLHISFPFWFIYDNDDTGTQHSMEVLRKGYKTFMWKKFKADYGIPDINPYISQGNKRKWDVTDIFRYVRDYHVQKKVYWSPYFTDSLLNGLNI